MKVPKLKVADRTAAAAVCAAQKRQQAGDTASNAVRRQNAAENTVQRKRPLSLTEDPEYRDIWTRALHGAYNDEGAGHR